MRVLVVGAGWYGCQVARRLEALGIEFKMVDRRNDFLMESSSNNQNRLHFGGFHYSRSHVTRVECRRGYEKFVEEYPEFSREVDSYYVVAKKSLLDFETYLAIFSHESSPFVVQTLDTLTSRGIHFLPGQVDGANVLLVKERWIDFKLVKEHFREQYSSKLVEYHDGDLQVSPDFENISLKREEFDLLFDATYGKMFPLENSMFEVCLTLVYKRIDRTQKNTPSVTVVDGDFFSLYPYNVDNNTFTLTHVKLTPMMTSSNIHDVEEFVRSVRDEDVKGRRFLIEEEVHSWYPDFLATHKYSDFFVSTKTKFHDIGCADRSMRECRRGNVISVCGGKVTGAFDVKAVVDEHVLTLQDKMLDSSK